MKVFLGGTCNDSDWREKLIEMLEIDYFNPVVKDWNEKAQLEEVKQRNECDFCLYVITPKMIGVYSIAEVIDDSNKRPQKTIFCYLLKDSELMFSVSQHKSLMQVAKMVKQNGAKVFYALTEIAQYLNEKK